jgi:hypothetical protein
MDTEGSFSGSKAGKGVKLTTYLHLVPMSRTVELFLHSPTLLYEVVLK